VLSEANYYNTVTLICFQKYKSKKQAVRNYYLGNNSIYKVEENIGIYT
jgi:hypothetical protein